MGYRSIIVSSAVKITAKDGRLVITGESDGNVPIEDIRTLLIENRLSIISIHALAELSENGVCVYICDEKHMPCAVLQPFGRYSRQEKRLHQQMEQSKPNIKRLWQDIVVAKIRNQARCLKLCGIAKTPLAKLAKTVISGDEKNVEAHAAAVYFKTLFGDDFVRGEDNGINAALNYGYAIVRGYIARTLANCGFEPCIGLHHSSELNNFNLADDIIEPFRPLVDMFVFQNVGKEEFNVTTKREICNILNYELLSGEELHSAAYAVERLVHSLERCFEDKSESLVLPVLCELKRHEYE